MSNITQLRDALFAQLENLQDPTSNLEREVKRTDAIIKVSEQIIDTGKLECMIVTTAIQAKMDVEASEFFQAKQLTDGK